MRRSRTGAPALSAVAVDGDRCHGSAMNRDNRNAAIAAFVIMAVFGLGGFWLPQVMLALGQVSTVIAGAFAVLFVGAFFAVFWLRGRHQSKGE